jgi:mgtE-like transporter
MGVRDIFRGIKKRPFELAFVSSFSDLITQGFVALFICALADIIAGISLGVIEDYLKILPGLLVLIPGAIAMRGNIYASLGARMGSYLHTGELSPDLREREIFNQFLLASFTQTLVLSTLLAFIAKGVMILFGMPSISLWCLIFISICGGVLAGIFLFVATILISTTSFKKGWDPDNVTTPLITAIGDITTVPSIFLVTLIAMNIPHLLDTFSFMFFAICGLSLLASIKFSLSRTIVLQTLPIFLGCALLSTFSGLVLEKNIEYLIAFSVMFLVVPVFNEEGGNFGSILAARLSSSVRMGLLKPKLIPEKETIGMFSALLLLSLIVFPLIGILAHAIGVVIGFESPGLLRLILVCLGAGIIITVMSNIIAYYTTYLSVRRGLDPDNVVIPIITACMDILGTLALIGMLILLI